MGGRGTSASRNNEISKSYPEFPSKTRYAKYEDTWYFEDASKEKFSQEANTGFRIQRHYYGGYHGRGTGSVTSYYTVEYRGENLVEGNVPGRRGLDTLKEAKEFLESQKRKKK